MPVWLGGIGKGQNKMKWDASIITNIETDWKNGQHSPEATSTIILINYLIARAMGVELSEHFHAFSASAVKTIYDLWKRIRADTQHITGEHYEQQPRP